MRQLLFFFSLATRFVGANYQFPWCLQLDLHFLKSHLPMSVVIIHYFKIIVPEPFRLSHWKTTIPNVNLSTKKKVTIGIYLGIRWISPSPKWSKAMVIYQVSGSRSNINFKHADFSHSTYFCLVSVWIWISHRLKEMTWIKI